MNNKFNRKLLAASLMAIGAGGAAPAMSQGESEGFALEEVVVTARRKQETTQDVPVTVNTVDSEALQDFNIREMEDVAGMVPGLNLEADPTAPKASMRGVRFDTFSGHSPTVEFYLNDAPVSPLTSLQAMFDVGQVEVLRGPQGTLRGKTAPSGSITVATRRPDLEEFGGYVDVTATDLDGRNVQAAVNVPIIENVLGLRVAGFQEENAGNHLENAFTRHSSESESQGYRVTLDYLPTQNIDISLMHQKLEPERWRYKQVESANVADPALPESEVLIVPNDRLSVLDQADYSRQELESTTLNMSWHVGQHQLSYVGILDETINTKPLVQQDETNAIDSSFPDEWQNVGQTNISISKGVSHELRLQSAEPLFNGLLDYVVGALNTDDDANVDMISRTRIQVQIPSEMAGLEPGFFVPVSHIVNETPLDITAPGSESSYFGNLTWYLTDSTEVSGGVRRINIKSANRLAIGGNALADTSEDQDATVYSFSAKHDLNDDMMAYFSYGTSYRAGVDVIGEFSVQKSPLQIKFTDLPAEESESFEIGVKSMLLDNRLRLNATAFHQTFDNYPYRPPTQGIFYRRFVQTGTDPDTGEPEVSPTVERFNFVAPVPVEVNGIELEVAYLASENFDLHSVFSYAKGEINNGLIPCNDYLPNDGVPDSSGTVPTLEDIASATDGENLTACQASYRSSSAPLWSNTIRSEYRFDMMGMESYVRGLWKSYGDSRNDPTHSLDDVDAYNIFDLYAGIRGSSRSWEAMVYVKNVTDVQRVTNRLSTPGSVSYIAINGATGQQMGNETVVSDYRQIEMNAPREFGVNFRYTF